MTNPSFPAAGKDWSADYGQMRFHLRFSADGGQMTFVDAASGDFSKGETVELSTTELRPQLWRVVWREESGVTVTQVEDFEKGVVYAAITAPDGQFIDLTGKWSLIGPAN